MLQILEAYDIPDVIQTIALKYKGTFAKVTSPDDTELFEIKRRTPM